MNINEYKTDTHVNPEERIHKNIYLLPQLEDNEIENEIMAYRDRYTNSDDNEISKNDNNNDDEESSTNNET